MSDWLNYIVKQTKDADFLATQGAAWIDVRDNATAHVRALQVPEAANERILLVYGHYKWQDWVLSARKFDPKIPKGAESYDPNKAVYAMTFKSDKMKRILGINKYIDMDTTTKNILDDFKARNII
ncbi:hypothetical protein NM688_g9155 [Phlebia brevispora]|uniref:Uncharacterized protein n=1 Tax=Phlebia brevispora TaxID=194682 RepID=A0ACC1RIU7_9APHY|nr:hypothetical protein NM688_g9155 [Phlebia brevispora]